MLKEEAKRYVLQKWYALPAEDRATAEQAALFAMKIANDVPLRSAGEKYQVINGWLSNCLARP